MADETPREGTLSTRVAESILQPAAVGGAWIVALLDYAGHLGLMLVQAVGGCFVRPIRMQSVCYEIWKTGIQSWFIVAMSSLFIGAASVYISIKAPFFWGGAYLPGVLLLLVFAVTAVLGVVGLLRKPVREST